MSMSVTLAATAISWTKIGPGLNTSHSKRNRRKIEARAITISDASGIATAGFVTVVIT